MIKECYSCLIIVMEGVLTFLRYNINNNRTEGMNTSFRVRNTRAVPNCQCQCQALAAERIVKSLIVSDADNIKFQNLRNNHLNQAWNNITTLAGDQRHKYLDTAYSWYSYCALRGDDSRAFQFGGPTRKELRRDYESSPTMGAIRRHLYCPPISHGQIVPHIWKSWTHGADILLRLPSSGQTRTTHSLRREISHLESHRERAVSSTCFISCGLWVHPR